MLNTMELSPNQVITLHDFPLHSEQVLKLYFRMYQQNCGNIVPTCPVLKKDLVHVAFTGKTKDSYDEYIANNPQVDFFLLDGSHKTTAATLARTPLSVIVFEKDEDIQEAKELVIKGELLSLTVGDSIQENVEILKGYFDKKPTFQTVEEKTLLLVEKGKIPNYMIEFYHQ
ncbi:MAG: hypothetical protein QF741_02615 [Candidatus Peribacteraceae bacterium]|nr:hypothetical protein [Candidatus Peribacteraceae bacterium]MDP7646091.1 hypothetical protein [Candidatus Peribacteraceae bacterium]